MITDQEYKVLADEVYKVDKGKVDTSQVVIAYAGTNSSDKLDIATDIQTVAAGSDKLKSFDCFEVPRTVDAQAVCDNYS